MAVLLLLAAIIPVAAQEGESQITVPLRTSPTGYVGDADFEDCHDNPGIDVTFTLDDRAATTEAAGNVVFENVATGDPIYVPKENPVELTIEPQTDPVALFVNLPPGVKVDSAAG